MTQPWLSLILFPSLALQNPEKHSVSSVKSKKKKKKCEIIVNAVVLRH